MTKAVAAWLVVASAMAGTTGPRDVVRAAVARVIAVLQQDDGRTDLDRSRADSRRLEIRRLTGDLFDYDDMARRTLSRHWSTTTPEQRAEFVQLFSELLDRSFVGRLEQFSRERILYESELVDAPWARGRSKIVTRRPAEITLDYRLRLRDGRWRVYDVLVDGVSFVATFRGEFDRIIQQSSYAGLVDKLRRRAVQTTSLH
jgi:phospholipid transport system substrate-binding protein